MAFTLDNTEPDNPIYADDVIAEEKRRINERAAELGRPLRVDEKLTIISDVLRSRGLSPSSLPLSNVLVDQSFSPGIPGYSTYTLPGALDTPEQRAAIEARNAAQLRQDFQKDVVASVTSPFQNFWGWVPWLLGGAAVVYLVSKRR